MKRKGPESLLNVVPMKEEIIDNTEEKNNVFEPKLA